MPIAISCPSCEASYRLADNMRGKTVICRECKEPIVVGSGGAARPVEDDVVEAEEAYDDIEQAEVAEEVAEVASEEVPRSKKRFRDDEDEDDIEEVEEADAEETPRSKKGSDKVKKGGLSPLVLIGGGVGAAAIVGVVVVLAMGGGGGSKQGSSPPTGGGSGTQVAGGVPTAPPSVPPTALPTAPPVVPPVAAPSAAPTGPITNTPAKPPELAKAPDKAKEAADKRESADKATTKVAKAGSDNKKKETKRKKDGLVVARMSKAKIYEQVVKSSVWVLGERTKFRLMIPDSFLKPILGDPDEEEPGSGEPKAAQPPGKRPPGAKPGGPRKKKADPEDEDDDDDVPLETIAIKTPLYYSGSGSLVSRKHRLILTNVHVAGDADKLIFHFPDYDDKGEPICSDEHYKKKPGIVGKLVARVDRADAALVQLDTLPPDIPVVPLAEKSARPGQRVHSVGSPGASAQLFNYSPGTVRQVLRHKWLSPIPLPVKMDHLMFCDSWVLETDSTTNQGDSGGPLVDDWGRLVGICQGARTNAIKVRQFIDIREIRALLKRYYKKIGETWKPETPEIIPAEIAAIPELQKKLDAGTALAERVKAIQELAALGPDAGETFGDMFKLLDDPDASVRRAAREALKVIPPDKEHVTLLCEMLKNTTLDVSVRVEAVKFLTSLGPSAKPAADVLAQQLKDADPELRKEMFVALLAIGPDPKHVPLLREAWQGSDPEIRRLAGESLIRLGPKAKPALPVLIGALKSPDGATRLIAARAIHAIGAEATDAKPNLLAALEDSDRAVGVVAALALVKLGVSKEVMPILVDTLANNTGDVRKQACQGLAALGPKVNAKEAVEWLVVALDEVAVRQDASKALVKIGKFSADIVADKMLRVINKDSRKECILILERIHDVSQESGKGSIINSRVYEALDRVQTIDPNEEIKKLAKRVLKKLTGRNGAG